MQCLHGLYKCVGSCPAPANPADGEVNCGDKKAYFNEDTCYFTCNTDYELTGSNATTCQCDGSWSGSDDVCRRGTYVW